MCVVSMIGDHFSEKWNKPPYQQITSNPQGVSQLEFDKLRLEVEEMKALLIKAKLYDEKNNEPNCELEGKMSRLREVAKIFGIDLDDVINRAGNR